MRQWERALPLVATALQMGKLLYWYTIRIIAYRKMKWKIEHEFCGFLKKCIKKIG